MSIHRAPPFENAARLLDHLGDTSDRAEAFVRSVPITADDVEIVVCQADGWGYDLRAGDAEPREPQTSAITRARVFNDGLLGVAQVDGDSTEAWFFCASGF